MAKENERAVLEMKALADSFEKEVAEEGELEPAARIVARHASPPSHSLHCSGFRAWPRQRCRLLVRLIAGHAPSGEEQVAC